MSTLQPNTLLVSTGKGLIIYRRNALGWQYERDVFLGIPVSMTFIDTRINRWWAALAHKHWGQKLHYSDDEGQTWKEVRSPKYPEGTEVKPGVPATLKFIWSIQQGGIDQPHRIYVGTEPGGLFLSNDNGANFQLVESLWNHPSRPAFWFGGGKDYASIHSIVINPRNSNHIYIAVSCAGVFETKNGGITWQPRNKGLRADYLPDPYVEVGHDPHLLLLCKTAPDYMWQQNHCGIFRSKDGGQTWIDVTDPSGLANYGFALAIDDENTERAWVIPALSDRMRVAVDRSLCVCRTEDGGKSWQALRNGLPQGSAYDIVFRHALARQRSTMAFGTTTGNLYLSENDGDSWQALNHNLPIINAVTFI